MAEKQISEEMQSLGNIQTLVQTYEEIAATRMQRVKSYVLNTRVFLSGLSEIYSQVKFSYEHEVEQAKAGSKKNEFNKASSNSSAESFATNGKTVSVLLSANTGLYGDIIRQTFNKFISGIKTTETDLVIVGRIGRNMFESFISSPSTEKPPMTKYEYFDLTDNPPTQQDMKPLVNHIIKYDKVFVYHGQFESILSQVPIQDALTGELPEEEQGAVEEQSYIFEPSLPAIISYFESQILASIFEQAVQESNLSKFASRMINLDRASVNISDRLKKVQFNWQRARHNNINKKQRDVLSSRILWK